MLTFADFDIESVFDAHYSAPVQIATVDLLRTRDGLVQDGAVTEWISSIKGHWQILYRRMIFRKCSSLQNHISIIIPLRLALGPCRTNETCLFCLQRQPETLLPCGHSLCDICVRNTSDGLLPNQRYRLTLCRLCGAEGSIVKLQPLTAGHRLLCLDGGGVRGKIIVLILACMQQHLANLKVPDLFDVVLGTSVGKRRMLCPSLQR